MKTPLHLKPHDQSRRASHLRLALWETNLAANPKGFRTQSGTSPKRRRPRRGRGPDRGITMKFETMRFLARHGT